MRFLQFSLGRKAATQDTELLLSDLRSSNGPQSTVSSDIATSGNKVIHQAIIPFFLSKLIGRFPSGWRFNVILSIFLGTSIFMVNLSVTIWASTKFPRYKGVATVYEGSCSKVKTTITCIHLGVNILGTLLLGASNVCMQLLCAPTREEVDAAHARCKWLGIGISNLKNLFYVNRKTSALWVLLGLSSIPLHLLWNSAFMYTLSENDYVYSTVTEGFLQGALYNTTQDYGYPAVAQNMLDSFRNRSLVSLPVTDCIKAYGKEFVSEYGNLLLIYDIDDDYNSLLFQERHGDEADTWMCAYRTPCDFGTLIRENGTHWNPLQDQNFKVGNGDQVPGFSSFVGNRIKYCLLERTDRPCRLSASLSILVIVLSCNVVKTACFIMTLLVGRFTNPLVTNGDAVQSFLLRPDTSLHGRCLVSRSNVNNNQFWSEQPSPRPWRLKRKLWASGPTISFWLATFIPKSGIILITTIIAIGIKGHIWAGGIATLVSDGFGKPTHDQVVHNSYRFSPPAASLLANTPQILVSYIYLAYNGLFTSMLATAEWADYSVRRRGLRVAWPRGQQRATSFLSLPYTYAVPIMTASTVLHWLISESLFLVRVTRYSLNGSESRYPYSVVGYSAFAAVFASSMGGAMLFAVLLVGVLKKYPATMPLAACCSASIAALCQPLEAMTKDDLTLKRLQWGVVDQTLKTDDHGEVEHACFSAGEVTPLIPGHLYA